ncbi:MAG: dotA [Gammaproteobacteria bacterium]|jgi:conjugal transfer/type IV secretion protein DotA/TraY|nr:dotA [Gammaproteobacteria bacterium]
MKLRNLWWLLLTLLSPVSLAAEPVKTITGYAENNPLSAYLPTSDYSLGYLKQMFGDVSGMIHSDVTGSLGGFIMGDLFRVFNSAMLVFAVVVLMYIVFTSTLRMAHEGEAMGLGSKEWSSPWIIIRAAIAMVMLVPQAGGYCLAQKIVMYIVLMGVAGANMMWSTAVDKMLSKDAVKSMITSQQPLIDSTKFLTVVETIYEQQACRWALYKNHHNGKIQVQGPFYSNAHRIPNVKYDTAFFTVGDKDQGTLCGGISWQYPYQQNQSGDTSSPSSLQKDDFQADTELEKGIENAVYLMYQRLEYAGKYFQDNPDHTCGLPPGGNTPDQQLIANNYGCFVLAMVDYTNFANSSARHIQYSKYADVDPVLWTNQEGQDITLETAVEKVKSMIKNRGWADAGSYFYNIAELSSASSIAMASLDLNVIPATYVYGKKNVDQVDSQQARVNGYLQLSYYNLNNYYHSDNALMQGSDEQQTDLKKKLIRSHLDGKINYDFGDQDLNGRPKQLFDVLTFGVAGWLTSWNYHMLAAVSSQAEHGASMAGLVNPVISLQELGRVQIEQAEGIWIRGLATIDAITLGSAGVSFIPFVGSKLAQPIAEGMIAMIQWLQSLMSPIAVAMFSSGFLLSTWLPFLPYILSIFCVFGWILSVVEMMVAAPIVALGILSPEGHSVFGKGSPAVLLSLAMFLRPILMIMGFIAGIIGVFIISSIVNAGFLHMVQSVFHNNLSLLTTTGIITMYTIIMTGLYNKSFGMMTAISNSVLRWIGGQHATMDQGESQMLDAVKSGVEGVGSKGAEAAKGLEKGQLAGTEAAAGGTRSIGKKVGGAGEDAISGKGADLVAKIGKK